MKPFIFRSLLIAILVPFFSFQDQTGRVVDLTKFTPGARAAYERLDWSSPRGAAHIVGFNYQPSWAFDGIKSWIDDFDANKYRAELKRGKELFPLMNTVRIWLNYNAWIKDPATVEKNVRTAFLICREMDLLVIPVLTSAWGSETWGTWGREGKDPNRLPRMEEYFLEMNKASDCGGNILVWDVCNEPKHVPDEIWDNWLHKMCEFVHKRFCNNRVTFAYNHLGSMSRMDMLDAVDLWSPHFYNGFFHVAVKPETAAGFKDRFSEHANIFRSEVGDWMAKTYAKAPGNNKPVISTECCWGSLDDEVRVQIVDETLKLFVELGIGFLPHALHESLAPDLHRSQYGPVGGPGYMAFIHMDGTLRPGHDIFNKYAGMALQGYK